MMHFRDDAELRTLLYQRWFDLREENRLDQVLPRSNSWRTPEDKGGYQTVDHRIHWQLPIPRSGANDAATKADIVETYWSVRIREGVPQQDWGPNLHINLVGVHAGAVRVPHIGQVFRQILAIRAGLEELSLVPYLPDQQRTDPMSFYVRGAVIGTSVDESAEMVDALLGCQWEPYSEPLIRVGALVFDAVEGISVKHALVEDVFPTAEIAEKFNGELVQKLIGADRLFAFARTKPEERPLLVLSAEGNPEVVPLRTDEPVH